MGGERGCAAAESNFRFAVETLVAEEEEGEKMKTRKPRVKRQARTMVVGFVLRMVLDKAMSRKSLPAMLR